MSITIEAIYEAGTLRPLIPLSVLPDKTKVRLTIEPAEKPIPQVRHAAERVDCAQENEWLRQHQDNYRGQWVVLDGDTLYGHTADRHTLTALVNAARAAGVTEPFVHLIPVDPEPVWMGWL